MLRAPLPLGVKVQGALHLTGYLSHACLLLMFILQPFLLYYSQRFPQAPSFLGLPLIWWAVASLPALAPGIYLVYAQWRYGERLPARLPYILGASVIGAGIMITTVAAMAHVIYGRKVVFERTPKYGIEGSSDSWDGKRYSQASGPVMGVELLVAFFAMGSVAYAAALHNWASFFYTGYFLSGLFLAIATSLIQMSTPLLPRALGSPLSGNRDP